MPGFKFKIILFQCKTKEEQDELIYSTTFEIIGPYLLFRHYKERKIWVAPLELTNKNKGNFLKPLTKF